MKKLITLLILSIFVLSSCSESEPVALHKEKQTVRKTFAPIPADFFPRQLTIVSAGDSLTEGIGDSTGQGGYLPYLKSMLENSKGINEVDFLNYGVKGNRTTQLLKRLNSTEMTMAIQKADLVILTIGGNDIMKVVKDHFSDLQIADFMEEKENYRDHLTQIIDTVVQENPNASIVLLGLYNPFSKWFSDIKELDEIVAEWNKTGQSVIANYPNAYFVDIEDLFEKTNENLLYTDNFHPNDKGYELIAGRLNKTMEEQVLPAIENKPYMVTTEGN
ncbi:SGNH/GDSL hydrolase family protein [Neobacillus dielmonensis]|uniref:SGNH/GDSL hydrolase family protein n=1 Tax=Neobacillus dielmonensis TaxID=1347369 RepID=UPI0005A7CBAA|nr:SGNH/GDSL hydrolase family protein [Neobacillus dielmonensis]